MSLANLAELERHRTASNPRQDVTPEDLIARARNLRPLLRERQDAHEQRGAYDEDVHAAFVQAGFYRITRPRLFGGYEFGLPDFYRTMMEIARGDPGVGWCLTLAASHGFVLASHWPEQAQREIFNQPGEFAAPHRAAPMGTAKPVAGGYIVNGRWNYCSGIPYATHLMANAIVDDGGDVRKTVIAVLPKHAYGILPDWGGDLTLGLRASGSNSVEVKDAFIPAHYAVPFDVMFARPDGMEKGTPGTRLHGNPMYLGRLMGPYHASLVAMAVGAAWAAIDEYEQITLEMKTYIDPTLLRADHSDFQRPLGVALAKTDAAEAVLMGGVGRYMDLCDRWARDRTPISIEDNLRLWTMIQQGGALASDAVETLFHAAGAFTTRKGNRLQRYFRDVQMYRTHMSAQREEFATYLARCHLGRPTGFRGL